MSHAALWNVGRGRPRAHLMVSAIFSGIFLPMLLVVTGSTSRADTFTWSGIVGSNFDNDFNWSGPVGQVPGAGDTAIFPIMGLIDRVEFLSSPTVATVDVAGDYLFEPRVADRTFTITGNLDIARAGPDPGPAQPGAAGEAGVAVVYPISLKLIREEEGGPR